MRNKRVAIIGGGIGGLSAAYYLHGHESDDGHSRFECTVFDRASTLGGNAHSVYGGEPFQPPFGDLGVNDFNTKTYTLMDDILATLDTTRVDGTFPFRVATANLLNTTCWYTPRGQEGPEVSYTDADLKEPASPFLERIAEDWHRFAVDGAARVLNDPDHYQDMTVGEFVREQGYSEDFAVYNLYARINGMYFMDDRHPSEMPILGVMSYYSLQEGMLGKSMPDPDRKYFVNGASDWIQRLAAYLGWRGVRFLTGTRPLVDADAGDGARIRWCTAQGETSEYFDAVILAVHADEVGRVVECGLPGGVARVLSSFRYFSSLALWHDDEAVMPPDPEQWRTYNIVIYPEDRYLLRPYTINYVCAMHQGRPAARPPFVSESPLHGVRRDRVRQVTDPTDPDGPAAPAVSWFRHNMVSRQSREAQRWLHQQQGVNGLYYTGGWTQGAGLHQEIMAVSLDVAKRLRGVWREDDANVFLPHRRDQLPLYLRVAAAQYPETHGDMMPEGFVRER